MKSNHHNIMKKIVLLLLAVAMTGLLSSSQIVTYGNELVRISPKNNHIESSKNDGRTWSSRYTGSYCGTFADLLVCGNEILAATSKGVYVSNNGGRSWSARYTGSYCGTFQSLASNGREILAQTDKGLYASTNGGRSWSRRR